MRYNLSGSGTGAGVSSNSRVNFGTWPATFPASTLTRALSSIYETVGA